MNKKLLIPLWIWKIMRMSFHQLVLFIVLSGISYAHETKGQAVLEKRVSLDVQGVRFKKVLSLLEEQTDARFIYSPNSINTQQKVKLKAVNERLDVVLKELLEPYSIEFTVSDGRMISLKPPKLTADEQNAVFVMQAEEDEPDWTVKEVRGRVIDEKGEGLPGVNILLKGTQRGVITDANGGFSIEVPDDNAVLVFSFVGYISQEVTVGARSSIDISLEVDEKSLEEVVVVGYGETRRRDLTGSVSSVSAKQLKDVPINSVAEALTGRLAGVHVVTTEGAPGAEVIVRVRGGGSITQDNTPLYIVDGIQIEDALAILAPQEIESIDVLKDAASTAIYGARGANGVVLITTKGGRKGRTQVSYNGFWGVRQMSKKLDVLSPYDFVKTQYQSYHYKTSDELKQSFLSRYGRFEDLALYKDIPFYDWQDELFGRDAVNKNHILSVSGGTEKTNFAATINHTDEEGIMVTSGFKRTTANFKLDHTASEKFSFGLNSRYSQQQIEGAGTSSTSAQGANRLRHAVRFTPYIAPGMERLLTEYDPEFEFLTELVNPIVVANSETRINQRSNLIMNGWFSYSPIKDLTFKSNFGINNNENRFSLFSGVITGLAKENNNQPVVERNTSNATSYTFTNTLSYLWKWGDHQFNSILGQEAYDFSSRNLNLLVRWFPADISAEEAFAGLQKAVPGPGLIQTPPSTLESGHRLLSFFGRLGYNYKGKILLNATLRRDGSSLFAKQNRNALFPAVAVAWRLSDEPFLQPLEPWLTDMKLRLSYGASGNNRIGVDLFKNMYAFSSNYGYDLYGTYQTGTAPNALANQFLRWETTVTRNLGLDFEILGGKLSGSLDLYLNNVKDLLLRARIPQTSGWTEQLQNIGETQNKGIEVQLNANLLKRSKFSYNANFNLSFNRNKIVDLGNDPSGNPRQSYLERSRWIGSAYEDFIVEVGGPVGQFYGYVTDGFYTVDDFDYNPESQAYTLKQGVPNSGNIALGTRPPSPGDLRLKKISNDGNANITTNDRTVLGNAQPKFIGGLNNMFTYKNLDLSIFLNWSVGNKVYNANKIEYSAEYPRRDNNYIIEMKDAWAWFDDTGMQVNDPLALAELNKDAKIWTPSRGNYILHSWAIEDGSFLRLNNVTLGYTLRNLDVGKMKLFSQMRIYATVNNLLVITGYSGYDPEASTRRGNPLTPGVDYAAYPRSRYSLMGLNITF